MIGLITWATPNEAGSAIMLGKIGLAYTIRLVGLAAWAQFAPEILAILPNNKIPSLIDRDQTGGRRVWLRQAPASFISRKRTVDF